MRKIIYLYILVFFACDPGWFGLEEELGIYSYHDGLALAWETFFRENDYDTSIAYINSVIFETEDEEYYNSAYTALGWIYLFKSNLFVGNLDSLTHYRTGADSLFSLALDQEDLAIIGYDTGCYYNFCCSDCFTKDRQLGSLYAQIEQYFILSNEEQNSMIINDLIDALDAFISENPNYDFMNGKPTGNNGESIDLGIDDVKIYLAHIYFRMGEFTECCNLLSSLDSYNCDLDCSIDWNNTNLDNLLDCFSAQRLF